MPEEVSLQLRITSECIERDATMKPKLRIFIIVPSHHSSHDKMMRRCLAAVKEECKEFEFIVGEISGCGVAKARNTLMAHAVQQRVDIAACWDSDICLPGETPEEWGSAFRRLVRVCQERGNVSALYACKQEYPCRWICSILPGNKREENGLLEVAEAGTGMKLVTMRVIDRMISRWPEIHYTADDGPNRFACWDLFPMGVVNGRYLSEDYYFDYRLRLMGAKIWVDTGIECRHRGTTEDGRIVDFPVIPLALPGWPAEQPPGYGDRPRYLEYDPFTVDYLKTDTQGWNSKAPIFERLLKACNPTVIIEVGSWKGGSTLTMLKHSQATIYCVDTWLGGIDHALGSTRPDGEPRKKGWTVWDKFRANITHSGHKDRVIPIPQTSTNGARWLKAHGVTASLIYLDASHELEDVSQDLLHYWELLNPGGLLFGDDYAMEGVQTALEWFCRHKGLPAAIVEASGHWIVGKPPQPQKLMAAPEKALTRGKKARK